MRLWTFSPVVPFVPHHTGFLSFLQDSFCARRLPCARVGTRWCRTTGVWIRCRATVFLPYRLERDLLPVPFLATAHLPRFQRHLRDAFAAYRVLGADAFTRCLALKDNHAADGVVVVSSPLFCHHPRYFVACRLNDAAWRLFRIRATLPLFVPCLRHPWFGGRLPRCYRYRGMTLQLPGAPSPTTR